MLRWHCFAGRVERVSLCSPLPNRIETDHISTSNLCDSEVQEGERGAYAQKSLGMRFTDNHSLSPWTKARQAVGLA